MAGKIMKLWCLVVPTRNPNPYEVLFSIEVDINRSVAHLKQLLVDKNLSDGPSSQLRLWKCAIHDNNLKDTLRSFWFDGSDNGLVLLDEPLRPLAEYFRNEDLPPDEVHLLVEELGKEYGAGDQLEDVMSRQESRDFFAEYVGAQSRQEHAIHDGLHSPFEPMKTVAPPIQIFHPVFDEFTRNSSDPSLDIPREFLLQVRDLMSFASQLQSSETTFNERMRSLLSKLLGVSIPEDIDADTDITGISFVELPDLDESAPFLFVEFKKHLGEGGYDPSIQAGRCMRRTWVQADRTKIRNKCCCPSFLLAGGGPWICILGAIFTDKIIVQRLTPMMWIALSSTNEDARIYDFARIMMQLRRSLQDLQEYYKNVSTSNVTLFHLHDSHPRFYPYPTSFIENGQVIRFAYMKMLEDDPGCVTYLAKVKRDAESPDIVVKFVSRYGFEAHRFLAEKKYSPRLRYYGPMKHGDSQENSCPASPPIPFPDNLDSSSMMMVIMDYVRVIPHGRPADAREQLIKILSELHVGGFVFGDLREPNILFNRDGKAQLIDLNWAGRYDMKVVDAGLPPGLNEKIREDTERVQGPTETKFVCYPLGLSSNIPWPKGVEELLPIRPRHDWEMLDKLWVKP